MNFKNINSKNLMLFECVGRIINHLLKYIYAYIYVYTIHVNWKYIFRIKHFGAPLKINLF